MRAARAPATVLALRALGLGDALSGVAALRGLRRAWPGAHLVLAGPPAPGALLRQYGVVDAVLPVDGVDGIDESALLAAAREHPDVLGAGPLLVGANLHGRGPQSVLALRRLLGARGTPGARLVSFSCAAAQHTSGLPWREEEPEVERWCRLVRDAGGRCSPQDLRLERHAARRGTSERQVLLHPGAASGARRWPAPRWAEVAARLVEAGYHVLVTGGPGEEALTAAVTSAARSAADVPVPAAGVEDLGARWSLPELADQVAAAALLVSGDTGVGHLATALGTPSVLLFGPTSPRRWGPSVDQDRHVVLWPAPRADYRGDPHGDALDPVLARTEVPAVVEAVRALLEPDDEEAEEAHDDRGSDDEGAPGPGRPADRDRTG